MTEKTKTIDTELRKPSATRALPAAAVGLTIQITPSVGAKGVVVSRGNSKQHHPSSRTVSEEQAQRQHRDDGEEFKHGADGHQHQSHSRSHSHNHRQAHAITAANLNLMHSHSNEGNDGCSTLSDSDQAVQDLLNSSIVSAADSLHDEKRSLLRELFLLSLFLCLP
jgi:hypothetical protein